MDKIILTVRYGNGQIISVPFPDLKSCDEFTMGFDGVEELGVVLNKILRLGIKQPQAVDAYINYKYRSRGNNEEKIQHLDVKYSVDVYDYEELKTAYAQFFQDDRRRINNAKNGIWHVNHESVREFIQGYKNISDESIVRAVNSYLDGSYKKGRDTYFLLKRKGYIIRSKKKEDNTNPMRRNLSSFEARNSYYAYLREYSKLGEEEYAKAMDMLAGEDMDDLRHGMVNSQYGVFDGAVQNNSEVVTNLSDEMMSLEELSGKSIEELMAIVEEYRKYYQSGSKRR